MVTGDWERVCKELGLPYQGGEVHFYNTSKNNLWARMPINACNSEVFFAAPSSIEVDGRRLFKRSFTFDGVIYTDADSPGLAWTPWTTTFEHVTKWMRATFTEATPDTVVRKIAEEYEEFVEAHFDGTDSGQTQSEVADLFMCLIDYCALRGWDPEEVIRFKLNVNLNRKWLPPDENGVVKHDPSA